MSYKDINSENYNNNHYITNYSLKQSKTVFFMKIHVLNIVTISYRK